MTSILRLVVLVTMATPLLAGTASPQSVTRTQAQGATTDPASAAIFYSQLEAEGRFSELYEYMHPDAQAIIPEAAVVGWYQDNFAPLGPGVITVTGVEWLVWTWPVTGNAYQYTAEVFFQQPFANGSVANEVVRLVEHNGEWRWFFGRSRKFVDEQIAKHDADPAQPEWPSQGVVTGQSFGFEPRNVAMRPGETSAFQMRWTSQDTPLNVEVLIPGDLEIVGQLSCTATALVVPPGSGNERARPEDLSCSGGWEHLPTEHITRVAISTSTATQRPISYGMLLQFNIQVPTSAEAGMLYTLLARNEGLTASFTDATVEVLDASGNHVPPLRTPTPYSPAEADDLSLSGDNLSAVFSPSLQFIRPGEPVQVSVALPQTEFGGFFGFSVTVPPELEVVGTPQCSSSPTCTDITLEMEVVNNRDGSTLVRMSGLHTRDDPAELLLTLRVPDRASVGTSYIVTGALFFGSRSAPSDEIAESQMKIAIEDDGN